MAHRKSVRERRRERIAQIVGQASSAGEEGPGRAGSGNGPQARDSDNVFDSVSPYPGRSEVYPNREASERVSDARARHVPDASHGGEAGRDPEAWWKDREKKLKAGQVPGWEGMRGLSPTSSPPRASYPEGPSSGFFRGLGVRFVAAALAFAGIWGWIELDLPGSEPAREWMVRSVTTEMDFEAIEAWYGDTFGGSPSFLPFGREEPDTREVAALPDPSITSPPVSGKIVESYAANGSGVKIAAPGGSAVRAIYTGQVQQVASDSDGGITVLVKHRNSVLSVYGGLETSSVKPNDWVETGQELGRLAATEDGESEGVLFFSTRQNEKTVDPAEVVALD